MKKVYIVVGLCYHEESGANFSIISEYGVKETLENAKQELQFCLQEIKKEWNNNEIEVAEENINDTSFNISNEYGEYYNYEIKERKITK